MGWLSWLRPDPKPAPTAPEAALPIRKDDDPAARFRACVAIVLKHEGGFVHHPRDPGGCTNLGITRATLERWRDAETDCAAVRALGMEEARAIYRALYWQAVSGDRLPAGVDLAVFDAAVNSGVRRAARWLQQSVGAEVDGAIGPRTLALVAAADPATVVGNLCGRRLRFLQSLDTWPVFGRGWRARVADVEARARDMARLP